MIKAPLLFGKYQLCRVIGTGHQGTVFLAVHKELEEFRAIKRVPKTSVNYEQFRREALILKSLRHQGIPIVYDLEEDETYSYLIEEYLEGITLSALILEQGCLSTAKTIQYGIQVCHLVSCLHSAKPTPILYLDLQPKNLILCGDTVKLVDFDHAASAVEANLSRKRYGTKGCAAPEQYTGEVLDERTDLYAIGVILYFFMTGTYPDDPPSFGGESWTRGLARVVKTCLEEEKDSRYQSAAALCQELKTLESLGPGAFKKEALSSLTIALAGSTSGVGVTHLAIGFSVYLSTMGYSTLYEEKNTSGAVNCLAARLGSRRDSYGFFRIHGLKMKPFYGAHVILEKPSCDIRVLDLGRGENRLLEESFDVLLLVYPGKMWNEDTDRISFAIKEKTQVIRIRNQSPTFQENKEEGFFACPNFPSPFILPGKARRFYKAVFLAMKEKQSIRKGGRLRGLLGTVEKKLAEKMSAP